MSDYESHNGTVKLLDKEIKKIDIINKKMEENNLKIPSYYKYDNEEDMNDFFNEEIEDYIEVEGKIYKIIENNIIDSYNDVLEAIKIGIDTFSFNLKYYNGGCGFKEALGDALNSVETKKLTKMDITLKDLYELWEDLEKFNAAGFEERIKTFKLFYNLTNREMEDIIIKKIF